VEVIALAWDAHSIFIAGERKNKHKVPVCTRQKEKVKVDLLCACVDFAGPIDEIDAFAFLFRRQTATAPPVLRSLFVALALLVFVLKGLSYASCSAQPTPTTQSLHPRAIIKHSPGHIHILLVHLLRCPDSLVSRVSPKIRAVYPAQLCGSPRKK
jgi:hypothetical protein